MRLPILAALLALASQAAAAADQQKFDTLPEPPPPAQNYKSPAAPTAAPAADEAIPEPEVVIIRRGEESREEYRLGGRLYMIKVTPAAGPPYYLVDHEGRGDFVRSDLMPSISPPVWVIKRF